jgi:hypothetical protein
VLSLTPHSRDHLRLHKRSSSMSVYLTAVSVCRSLRARLSQSKTPTPMFDGIPSSAARPSRIYSKSSTAEITCRLFHRFTCIQRIWLAMIALLRTSLLSGYVRLYISAIGMPSRIPIMLTPLDRRILHHARLVYNWSGSWGEGAS